MACLFVTPEMRKLHSEFKGETLSSVRNMVGLWQERNDASVDTLPSAKELNDLYDEVRSGGEINTKVSKDELDSLLDGNGFPAKLTSFAERLGIHLAVNRKTREITVKTIAASNEDLRLFRALAIDFVYKNQASETAFEMTPRERLSAIIDWENKHRRSGSGDVSIMNYELQMARKRLRDEYGLSTDGVVEGLRRQAAEAFTSKERMDRILDIVTLFDKVLTRRMDERLKALSDRRDQLNAYKASKNKTDFPSWETASEAYDRELGEIQQKIGSYTRMNALKEIGPKVIFDEIRQTLSDLAARSGGRDEDYMRAVSEFTNLSLKAVKQHWPKYKDQIQKVVDNFEVLREEACKELETSELIHIEITYDDSYSVDEGDQSRGDDDSEGAEDVDVSGAENQYKENWMYEFDTSSNWSKMSGRVRNLLYNIPRSHSKTIFGSERHIPVMQVINTLNNELQGVTNSRDMVEVLRTMRKEHPWVDYIIDKVSKDSRLKTELFRVTRRYAQTLGVLRMSSRRNERGDTSKDTLMLINVGRTENTVFTAAMNQLASGEALDIARSVYNDDGSINTGNVDKLINLIESKYYNNKENDNRLRYAEPSESRAIREEFPDLVKDIVTVLKSIGIAVDEPTVKRLSVMDKIGFSTAKNNLYTLLSSAHNILQLIKKKDMSSVDDIVGEEYSSKGMIKTSYRTLAGLLSLYDNGEVETSIRENGKTRYTYVLPSVLDDLILGTNGKMFSHVSGETRINHTASEYLENKFGQDQRYAYRDAEGNLHYRNWLLESWKEGGPQYVTILNADIRGREKVEQKDMTQEDRFNIAWAMLHNMDETFNKVKFKNTEGYWYPITLPSDSGRIAFIRTTTPDNPDEIIREAIIKELERMTEDESGPNLPKTFLDNKDKFCTFPVLNNPDIAKYSVSDIVELFRTANNTDQRSELDKIVGDLVEVVKSAMVEKFKEENEAFYNKKVNEAGIDAVERFAIYESLFQMALNEILNGDPAYYTGYNKGSDNIQKRAKQSIVPLDHIDVFNEDFLKAYKASRGLDPDAELEESDITERCLYITDPKIPSPSYDDLKLLYDDAIARGVIDRETYDSFLRSAGSIKYTDGQSFRSFDSMVMMMYGLGEMSEGDELDLALHRIAEGRQNPDDAKIVRTALKPFVSGLVPFMSQDGTTRLIPVQHKLSEQVLTAALLQASGTRLGQSPALRALDRVLRQQRADVVIFTSGVKVGQNGAVDLSGVDPETASEDEIVAKINENIESYRKQTGLSLIHEIPYSLYGIVAQNPNKGDGETIPIGTQLQKLISADLPDEIREREFVDGEWKTTVVKAKYHVEGVGDLTRHEVISLYNKLMTEKILRAYEEVTGTFADKKELSDALIRSSRNSSRNSAFLERAFSLDEYGNFNMPLCDLATLNMSSEFLNSIIKNAVSRITAPGKQFVSMSAFGVANDLKIEFERDENGYPIAYKSIDCLLPAWSEDIIKKCTNDNGVLDFSKLEKESPDLLRMIGVRIPTQFKNFILPLKCVGFLPTILGDTIVTAIDSVTLQDSDFDNDKVPTILPSFTVDDYVDDWEKKIRADYRKYQETFYDYNKLRDDFNKLRKRDRIRNDGYDFVDFMIERLNNPDYEPQYRKSDSPEGKPISMSEYISEHKEEYKRPDGPKLRYVAYNQSVDIRKQSDEAINNGIINVMYGMLTGRAVSTMSLAVGSTEKFDPIIKKLEENSKQNTYPDGPADIASRIGQETRNNDGKQMISVFANATSMQALLQHTDVGLIEGMGVTINGRSLHSLHDMMIDGSLEYVSRYIGTALGAAADNAKDPKLSIMNINLRTAPVVSLMLMLGYTMEEVAFFLNIPSIRHFTDTGSVGDGYKTPDASDLPQTLPGDLGDMLGAIRFGDNPDDMTAEMLEYNNTALGVFTYLMGIGERMRRFASLTRGDSGSSSPHGPLENNLARLINLELFEEIEEEDPLFENWRDVINYDYSSDSPSETVKNAKNPLAQAYISYGVVTAFKELSKYYPGISDPEFKNQIKNIIKKYYGGRATPVNVKNVMYSLYAYIESAFDCFRKGDMDMEQSRMYYIETFPQEAARIVSSYPELTNSLFFKRLKMSSLLDSEDDPFISLAYDGVMLPEVRDEFTTVWQQLFYAKNNDGTPNMELRELALDLFKYCYHRNGFRFTSGSFAHLAPLEARLELPGYQQMMEAMSSVLPASIYSNFEQQFVRNNLYDKKFCQTVPKNTMRPDGWIDKDGNPSDIVTIQHGDRMSEHKRAAMDWYFGGDSDGVIPRVAFVITTVKDGKISYNYYVRISDNTEKGESTYLLTTPLGWKDNAIEFSAKSNYLNSIYDQSTVAESLRPKNRRANRIKSRRATTDTARREYNSSEAPNEPNDPEDYLDKDWIKGDYMDYPIRALFGRGLARIKAKAPDIFDSKDFQRAVRSFKKSSEYKKELAKAKSRMPQKEQVRRTKDGGNKSSKMFRIIEDNGSNILDVEAHIARGVDVYTICVTDPSDYQFARAVHSATPNDSHFVADRFDKGNSVSLANSLWKKLSRRTSKSIVLNLTGSSISTIHKYATQDELDSYVLNIFRALKNKGIFVSKVVSSAQPGIALASARAAMELNYTLEVYHTKDYKLFDEPGQTKPKEDKDAFLANLSPRLTSDEYKSDTRIYDKEEGPFIIAKNNWTRDIAAKDKNTLYVFSDNTDRTSGSSKIPSTSRYAKMHAGGKPVYYPGKTSAVIRGLENAYPISTQKTYSPSNPKSGQWNDSDISEFRRVITSEVNDIIEAFESGAYKRVVIPAGGFFGGPISEITQERTPKLYKELSRQLERLSDSINEIAESIVNTKQDKADKSKDEYDSGLKTNDTDMLTADKIQFVGIGQNGITNSNLYVVDIAELAGKGIKVLDSIGDKISVSKLFVVLPKGEQKASSEHWSAGEIYAPDGARVTEDILFTLRDSKNKYNLLEASQSGLSLAAMNDVAKPLGVSSKNPLNKSGLIWLDDNNEPLCK